MADVDNSARDGNKAMLASQSPRDDLIRAISTAPEFRETDGERRMVGHFAVFDRWTEIDSLFEGRFMERIKKGSFAKTIKENRKNIRSLFQHGRDPQVGDKPLGPIEVLQEDDEGAYAEVRMLDTSYNRDIIPGIEAGQYGQSFRFRVTREEIVEEPEKTDHNPDGLPERTIKEVQLMEFGPVTFPAYAGTDVGMRSLTDEFVYDLTPERVEQLRSLIETSEPETSSEPDAGSDGTSSTDDAAAETTSSEPEHRPEPAPIETERKATEMADNRTIEELRAERDNVQSEIEDLKAEVGTNLMTVEQKSKVEELAGKRDELEARIRQDEELRALVGSSSETKRVAGATFNVRKLGEDIHDLSTVPSYFEDPARARSEMRDRAMKWIETARFPDVDKRASREDMQDRVSDLVNTCDNEESLIARRILATGHPLYEGAFWKKMQGRSLSTAEQKVFDRAALLVGTAGYAVPAALDPTVTLISNGVVNPLRAVARVVTIPGNVWNGVNSAGISASYDAEGAEVSEDTPTLTQPTATVLTARAFVPFSIEAESWDGLRSELTREIVDSKDVLEGTQFTLGTAGASPQGIMVGATYLATTAGSAVIALGDIDTLTDSLAPRFQAGAVIMAHRKFYSKVRQLDIAAGVNSSWAPRREGFPQTLNGYEAYENSNISALITTTGSLVAVVGDFSQFIIVDSVGMNVEYIPTLFHTTTNYPSGQRGLFAYWRNTSVVKAVNAFRLLKIL